MKRSEHIRAFVRAIWRWYGKHKRMLPWRDLEVKDDTERAYRILVSEVMLQQTQVPRVKIVFKDFLKRFPRMRDLAGASNRDVLIAWRGMGYNSRALRLRDAAKIIVERFHGIFPKSMEELQQIKGIGHYTAAAIRNFAFGIPTPCLETNIRRVLHRTFVGPENPDGTWKVSDREFLKLAEEVLEVALEFSSSPSTGSGQAESRSLSTRTSCFVSAQQDMLGARSRKTAEWHAALMDFGSLVQTKTNPKWDLCPLTRKGIMKTTPLSFLRATAKRLSRSEREPGRTVGSRFIPNRIFRGRIVEELRDAKRGLPLSELGKRVCLDWKHSEHEGWLKGILTGLERDELIESRKKKYALKS